MDKSHTKKVIVWIIVIIVIVASVGDIYLHNELDKITTVSIPESNVELAINEDTNNLDKEVVNIALFGVDSRDDDLIGRSDSIIILSIDESHNTLKFSSIMRDSYVAVDGHGMTKINHAFSYGGPALAIKTLNGNFNLNIKNYFAINFANFKKIIDAIGGVQVDIKDYELHVMRTKGIYTGGTYTLTGEQALAYSRIRFQGNGDFERTDRHRTVLLKVLEKIKSAGVTKFPKIVDSTLPFIETNMTQEDIVKLGTSMLTLNSETVEQVRFPVDGYCQGKMIDGIYYLVIDIAATTDQIHKFIYDDLKPKSR